MKLSRQDAEHYYLLMWALQFYVNQKLKIYPDIKTIDALSKSSMEEKCDVRDALYENIHLIDRFVQENPQHFNEEDLRIVSGWKNFILDDFHIERILKKYTVFIRGDDVYAVLGIYDGFDEMIHRSYLPLYVRTVLLPFKGKIIYDGLFKGYKMFFGGGVKRNLKEIYMTAKQNSRIIETLEPDKQKTKKQKPAPPLKDWTPELKELAAKAQKLKGGKHQPAIYTPAFSMIKASIAFAQLAVSDAKDPDQYNAAYKKMNRALKKIFTTLRREEF